MTDLKRLAEKIFILLRTTQTSTDEMAVQFKLESLLRDAMEEAVLTERKCAFVKENPHDLEIEGVRYAKELFRILGKNGAAVGTLLKLEYRSKDGWISIRTLKWDEAIKEAMNRVSQCKCACDDSLSRTCDAHFILHGIEAVLAALAGESEEPTGIPHLWNCPCGVSFSKSIDMDCKRLQEKEAGAGEEEGPRELYG